MPKDSKKKRAAKERELFEKWKLSSLCVEMSWALLPSGQKLFVPSKTVNRVDAEAPLKVKEISIYYFDCGLFEEFADALADSDNCDPGAERSRFALR